MTTTIETIATKLGLKKAGKTNGEIQYYDPHDQKTPDLYIDTENERWYTFSNGQNKGGGYIDLIKHVKNYNTEKAQEWLAQNTQKTINDDQKQYINKKETVKEILEKTTALAQRQLQRKDDLRQQIKENRNFDDELINDARIGYINETVENTLRTRYKHDDLVNSGLFKKTDDGTVRCILKDRIVFPYITNDEVIYMAGRKTQDWQEAKYKKTVSTDYNRHILYQFRHNRDNLIITEGFTDALSAWKAGYDVVSPATVKFKDDDIKKIRRVASEYKNVYIINDGDEAGQEGAKDTAIEMTKHGVTPYFVMLDDGQDLDDWTTEHGYNIDDLLNQAQSYIDHLVKQVKTRDDPSSQVEAKKTLYEAVMDWPQTQRKNVWRDLNSPAPVLEYEMRQHKQQLQQDQDHDFYEYTIPTKGNGEGRKFSPKKLAVDIMDDYDFAKLVDSDQFLVYEDGYWQRNAANVVKQEISTKLGHEYNTARKRNVKEYIEDQSHVERKNFQTVSDKVNVKNGVVDLNSGDVLPHSPSYNFQFKIPWRYDPDAECPEIDSFLDEITNGDETKKKKLYQLFGYVIMPDLIDEKAGVLVGSGSNGKTIVIELMKELLGHMGNAYTNKSLQDLQGSRFSTNMLFGKVANFDDDMPSKKLEQTGLFKKLTGGTDQGAEIKFGSQYNFKPYASMIFAANYLPKTDDQSNGFYRRWYMVHLPVDFVDNPADEDPLQKQKRQKDDLLAELTSAREMRGLLRKAVDNAMELRRNGGFAHDRDWREKRELWERHSEPVSSFIKRFISQGVTKTEANSRQSDDDNSSLLEHKYDYIRKDCLYDMILGYTRMISGEDVSKKDIEKALNNSTLQSGVVQPRSENRTRCYSGVKMELPPKEQGGGQGVPLHLWGLIEGKYSDSQQSVYIRKSDKSVDEVVMEVVSELDTGSGVNYEEVFNTVEDDGFDRSEIKKTVNDLKDDGALYEPKPGRVKKL